VLGRDPATGLASVDAPLPARRSTDWHPTGRLVVGRPGRRRRGGSTLEAADLRHSVDAAGTDGGDQAPRGPALAALHCFSGLRAEEIVHRRWEDLVTELTAAVHDGLTAVVERNGRRVRLIVRGPASHAVEALAGAAGGTVESLSGPVLCARSTRPTAQLSGGAGRASGCLSRAGLPAVESSALRAACAHWLRSQGLSDHEVAPVLGLARVRSVDHLLRRHAALDAQRAVKEVSAR
jgi:integrase